MDFLNSFNLSSMQWLLIAIVALMVGLSKAGIAGLTMVVIPILASVFGGKASTGIMLPMLIIGDIFGVWYYHRHADWKSIKKLLPWTAVGLIFGVVVGNYINDTQFKMLIGFLVLICLILLIYTEKKSDNLKIPQNIFIYIISGVAAGFATMIGNAAGPIFSVYLLASGFKKNGFIGTTAWFFLIVNLAKVPLQVFVWKNVTLNTFVITIIMLPAIALGVFVGVKIVKKINERVFKYFILVMTAISAIRLFM